jgi:hypothetical protein
LFCHLALLGSGYFQICAFETLLSHAAIFILYGAAALSGAVSAACLEQVKPTMLTDFVWSLTPVALFLFPIALVFHSIRIYRFHSTVPAES